MIAFRFSPKPLRWFLAVAGLAALSPAEPALAQNAKGPDIVVMVDQASLVRIERPAAEIIVGNPSIADIAVQSGKVLIATGKSFGETNLIVIDADGKVILSRRLIVQEPRTGFVTLYRGSERQTLHCAPYCAAHLVIGDAPDKFGSVSSQITTKQSIGQSSAEGDKP